MRFQIRTYPVLVIPKLATNLFLPCIPFPDSRETKHAYLAQESGSVVTTTRPAMDPIFLRFTEKA